MSGFSACQTSLSDILASHVLAWLGIMSADDGMKRK
jgi:hypothetical protein